MHLTIRNVWGEQTYYLTRYGNDWEWQSYANLHDGFGPFASRDAALAFGRRVGSVSGRP